MSYKVENIHFNDTLNVGINTETQITGTPGKIITIVDEDGGGIILPNGNVDQKTPNYYLTFQNTYLGSFSYNTNDDVFDIYSKHGWCPFDVNYLDNTSKADNNSISIIQNVTRIDFNNNKMSFRTDPSGITPVERLVINSSGNVGIGKSDIISNYDPSVKLDVNGSIHCLELYLNGTLLNPAPIYNLSGTITITNTGNRNINVSKIETNNLTINNCLTIKQTLDIYNNVNVNGTLIGNAMYKSTVSPNETSKSSSDKMYIHDVDINSVGLPKRTGQGYTNDRIYYRTDNNRIKTRYNTDHSYAGNILIAQDSNVINPPTLFNGTNPSGFNEVKSITYDTNWWGFELGKTSNNMICLGNILNSIADANRSGSVVVTISDGGDDTFGYESTKDQKTGFNIYKSGYYYASVVFPLNGSTNSTKTFTFGFLKNTYSGTPLQNIGKTYSEFYQIAGISPLDDNDILFRIGSSKDTNYQIEGFSSNSPSVTPLPDPETGRIVTQANSNSSMNYSYEYSFPFVIATDGPHFVSFFATADGSDYTVHNGLRIRFIKYADFDETDFITSTYGSNSEPTPVSTNQAGVVLPNSTNVTWLSNYATNGIPNGISNATQVATLTADTGDAVAFVLNSYQGINTNTSATSTLSNAPFYIEGNQLKINTFLFSRTNLNTIRFELVAYNTNGPQPSPTSKDISVFFPVPSSTIVTWDDISFSNGNVLTETESGVTLATLSADTGDATSFSLITGSSLLTINGSSLKTNREVTSDDVGDFSFSIKAVNDTGTQVTATDFTLTVVQGGIPNTATVSILGTDSQINTLVSYTPSSTTGSYQENEYTDSDGNTYIAVRFTDDGSITFDQDTSVDYLVVGGGGGGGSSGDVNGSGAGGGGAGGYLQSSINLSENINYNITIGAGGGGRVGALGQYRTGYQGEDSTFGTITAIGGGGGFGGMNIAQTDGGSGGGGMWRYNHDYYSIYANIAGQGDSEQGNDGDPGENTLDNPSYGGGGGGGAGEAGSGSDGGDGLSNSLWDGTSISYAGGGGGGLHITQVISSSGAGGDGGGGTGSGEGNGGNGSTNTGGGGGSGGNYSTYKAGDGGSGVVIIRFLKYQSYEETTSTDIISSYTHPTENVDYNSVKFTDGQFGFIKFDQITLVNYLLVGGESTPSNSLDNDYWSGTDETYEGLTIIENTTVVDADISYQISTSSTGAIFNDITAAGTSEVSSAVILRYTSLQPVDINTSTESGTFETNVYTPDGVVFYKAVKFTEGTGSITFDQDTSVDYLVVGGGGGGGSSGDVNGSGAGGGGAGGYLQSSINLSENINYNITIGAGGGGRVGALGQYRTGYQGEDSTFGTITAIGGGGGFGGMNIAQTDGGSGGGGMWRYNHDYYSIYANIAGQGDSEQGNDGDPGENTLDNPSYGGGGGGGAGEAGSGSDGGDGLSNSLWDGTSISYAGGGGGGLHITQVISSSGAGGDGGGGTGSGEGNGGNGSTNTGGGGGSGGNYSTYKAGDGGSGVVIVRYQIFPVTTNTYSVTGTYEENEYTDDNGDMYLSVKFTDDGSITFDQDTIVDYLVVGGGGSGGTPSQEGGGGGGGAGGMIVESEYLFTSGNYTINVGEGGAAKSVLGEQGENGSDSSISFDGTFLVEATGGGGGGWAGNSSGGSGSNGGSGGGGGNGGSAHYGGGYGVSGQGSTGGTSGEVSVSGRTGSDPTAAAGGGGGAGEAAYGYQGGDGLQNNFETGIDQWYAGGGGGGAEASLLSWSGGLGGTPTTGGGADGSSGPGNYGGTGGTANTGGGGGGGGTTNGSAGPSSAGGSGVVIIRFLKYSGL